MMKRHFLRFGCRAMIALLLAFTSGNNLPARTNKITPDAIIARHLEAIGTPEARAAIQSRIVKTSFTRRGLVGYDRSLREGQISLISSAAKFKFSMLYDPYEKNKPPQKEAAIILDGARTVVPSPPSPEPDLLSFLQSFPFPLDKRLFGGVLSTAWPLLNFSAQNDQLKYEGVKKVEGRPAHVLEYVGADRPPEMTVRLFFDAENFRHLRTEYRAELSKLRGENFRYPNIRRGGIIDGTYTLTEEFGDFRAVDGLTLPHRYRLKINLDTSNDGAAVDWVLQVKSVSHKEPVNQQTFQSE